MSRYQIWDRTSDIYTPSNEHFTPEQWKERYPWINIPGAKMIITSGIINGGVAMEFEATVEYYKKAGANISDGMTDVEILTAIENYEDNPPGSGEPSVEERTAAALEFLAVASLPDEF